MEQPEFDQEKFGELIVHLASECHSDPYFGATKLNKLLFFADFLAYKRTGHPITGAEYQALEYGPAPISLMATRGKLEREGAVERGGWGPQERLGALRPADLAKFSAEELEIVQEVIDQFASYDTSSIVEASHEFLGWRAGIAERSVHPGRRVVIPYSTALVSSPPISEAEQAHIRELAAKYEWHR